MGLNDKEVEESRKKYGSNIINDKNENTFFNLLLESLGDPIIKILLIALAIKILISFRHFDWYETIGIIIAILLASVISSISEYGSNKAFKHLQEETSNIKCKVYRNNKLCEVYISNIVVNDIISLSSGDKIPADGIVISGQIICDEAFLSGEAKEITKNVNDFVYSGSNIYKGNSLVRITKVGKDTIMGSMIEKMQVSNEESPLRKKLRILANEISKLGYIGAVIASLSYLFLKIVVENNFCFSLIITDLKDIHLMFSYFLYALTLTVTIIIMAVPEGLPMMITIVLSSNMKRMLKDNVLVRKLVGIETSGSLNVLLCDKTGTLTEGKLELKELINYNNISLLDINNLSKNIKSVICDSLYLNNETIFNDGKFIGGNTTDRAIMAYIYKYSHTKEIIDRKNFDSDTKYSYVRTSDYYYFKGASEKLLPLCNSYLDMDGKIQYDFNKENIIPLIKEYTSKGYRVLVNAISKTSKSLTFISLIILSDTIRKEAKPSIEIIKKSGIHPVMITGDDANTASNIAEEIGLKEKNSITISHDELVLMKDNELIKLLPNLSIVSRALPDDKARLVKLYKQQGLIVGMTGDGVNDCLALKNSDVAFALGSGCEVAKEASDIVILDNNISSICNAILYGRTIFKSIRKFITYQLIVNICALILSILGPFIGVITPITIVQMLWLNMIMDTFVGLAFSYEPPKKEYLKEKPKSLKEKILNKYMISMVIINGLTSAILCIVLIKVPYFVNQFRHSLDNKYLLTGFFALFVFLGITNSFLVKIGKAKIKSLFDNKVFLLINIFIIVFQIIIIYKGGELFRAYGLTISELKVVLLLNSLLLPINFLRKSISQKMNINSNY